MIITIKNLQQQTFTIDFDPEKTVLELKNQIFYERGAEYLVEKQKLIYAGVILTDERTISSYKVDEKKFIVVMLSRDISGTSSSTNTNADGQRKQPNEQMENLTIGINKKPVLQNANASSNEKGINKNKMSSDVLGVEVECTGSGSSSQTQVSTAAASPIPAVSTAITTDYSSIDLVGELANASLQSRAESNLLMGEEFNRTVASMVEMGYPREQVERAMAASFNNPERAVEYLINGIPQDENLFNPGDEEEPNRVETGHRQDPFEFLRSQPQFLQMRSLIYQNPHLLHAVLQQIGQTNPALLQLISENQDAFLNMLNQPLDEETGDNAQRTGRTQSSNPRRTESTTTTNSNDGGHRSVAISDNPSIAIGPESDDSVTTARNIGTENLATIRLTPQDQDAIERLKALGFPEALVLQAYFACEKDEELAANFLLSSSFDD
ncbi:UV excision repair protein RAD23 homolog B isoform X2 [Drosophila navojoa]|uniref:UV excision repair protein RAD23 homolog B isoform X2 n=1 Tax=Drosophila navojoa TaxID=7232 RepID=UPI000847D225|nr:UV excision repair protein RAD23 homolog B isoform X2 [Drosophila navojoa]